MILLLSLLSTVPLSGFFLEIVRFNTKQLEREHSSYKNRKKDGALFPLVAILRYSGKKQINYGNSTWQKKKNTANRGRSPRKRLIEAEGKQE